MSYQQLVQPNLDTGTGRVGYCLAKQDDVWGAPHIYPTARAAWDAAQYRHPGEEPPDGVAVLMWWDYLNPANNGNNDGHVASSLGDGTILSSPYKAGTTQAILPSRAELERIYSSNGKYPLTYLGWSEDIANVRVAQPQEDDVVKIEDATNWYNRCNITYRATRGRELDRDTFVSFVGKEFLTFVEYCEDDPEADIVSNWQAVGQQAVAENWQQEIADLTAELKEAQDKPAPEPQVITKTVRTPIKDYTFGEIWNGFWQKIANK